MWGFKLYKRGVRSRRLKKNYRKGVFVVQRHKKFDALKKLENIALSVNEGTRQ